VKGIIFFGGHSFDVASWSDSSILDSALDTVLSLTREINASGHSTVNVPVDWSEIICDSQNFWDRLYNATQGHNDLVGYVVGKLFNEVFNSCVDKTRTHRSAELSLTTDNPSIREMEYYGVMKLDHNWPNIPIELQVSSNTELYNLAKKFLVESPLSEESYTVRCKDIFSNLLFHPNFMNTLKAHGTISAESNYSKAPITGICGFSKGVTNSLETLNSVKLDNKSTQEILAEIAAKSGFACTPEGGKNNHLKFRCDSVDKTINCEFHIKINKNNTENGVYYQDRIYFGFVTENELKKIYVVHSGNHL
jgi:hypothetical protein